MESCPTQAVLPLVGLAADSVIRDRDSHDKARWPRETPSKNAGSIFVRRTAGTWGGGMIPFKSPSRLRGRSGKGRGFACFVGMRREGNRHV
ncbi:MAG: hypothetical protein R6U98_14320 [Pirellulaceae bacterium]